ncbi:hypothetical protein CRX72_10030 [Pantoea sp. BRM17]|nr:hypothetical protein CRX72_10030 [Pantoea sp. BRM17]
MQRFTHRRFTLAAKHPALCEPDVAPESASCHWTRSVQHQLNQQFRDAAHYAGQQCWLRLEWQASGRFAVTQTQGDEALCLRALILVLQRVRGMP